MQKKIPQMLFKCSPEIQALIVFIIALFLFGFIQNI